MCANNDNIDVDQARDNLIFDLIKRRFDAEGERTSSLDGKAGNLVGYVSVVVGLLLGGGGLFSGGAIFKSSLLVSSSHGNSLIYFIGVALLLGSIGLSLTALKVRRWITVPNVQTLISDYITLPYSEVLQRNAVEMANAVSNAEKQNNSKGKLIEWSWYLLISGLSIVFAAVLILSISGPIRH